MLCFFSTCYYFFISVKFSYKSLPIPTDCEHCPENKNPIFIVYLIPFLQLSQKIYIFSHYSSTSTAYVDVLFNLCSLKSLSLALFQIYYKILILFFLYQCQFQFPFLLMLQSALYLLKSVFCKYLFQFQ